MRHQVKHNRRQWKTSPLCQTYKSTHHFKLDFQKVDQHTACKWLIHGTKHCKDNQLQSLEPPVGYPSRQSKHDIKQSEGNISNSIFKGNVQGRKHPGRCACAEPELLCFRKSKRVVCNNNNNGHKNSNDSHNYHDDTELYQGISKRNT